MASVRGRRRALAAAAVIGLAVAAAPLAFQMFTRAPKGGDMITDFRPYMTDAKIAQFRGYLAEMDSADAQARTRLHAGGNDEVSRAAEGHLQAVDEFSRQWPVINADMSDMLDTMEDNQGNYSGVAALPPFPLFPWFFVLPGLIGAGLALTALRRTTDNRRSPRLVAAVIAVGVGLVAAPGVFQMFTRAPGGAHMIDDFRPLMTNTKVTTVQGYFLTLGAGEGQLRAEVFPALTTAGIDPANALPAVATFSADWPRISNQMAPMIGTMADNLDNYAAVDALPPFWMFPWFFVLPGLVLIGLGIVARRDRDSAPFDGLPSTGASAPRRAVTEGSKS